MSRYADRLRDPRWQKMRLLVLERDGFKCTKCGAAERELHVHHLAYRSPNPWDADPADLQTVCKDCHEWHHQAPARLARLADLLGAGPCAAVLAGWAHGVGMLDLTELADLGYLHDRLTHGAIRGALLAVPPGPTNSNADPLAGMSESLTADLQWDRDHRNV